MVKLFIINNILLLNFCFSVAIVERVLDLFYSCFNYFILISVELLYILINSTANFYYVILDQECAQTLYNCELLPAFYYYLFLSFLFCFLPFCYYFLFTKASISKFISKDHISEIFVTFYRCFKFYGQNRIKPE